MSARDRRKHITSEEFIVPAVPLSEADAALFGQIAEVDNHLASISPDGSIQIGSFTLTARGLLVNKDATYDEWERIGALLQRLDASIQWLIGDWMAFGERVWGQTYEQVAEMTGYSYQTLRDYAWVAANVDLSIRIDKLTFSHHRLVAGMEPEQQLYWLNRAAAEGWSISQMRAQIANHLLSADSTSPARLSASGSVFSLQIPRAFKKMFTLGIKAAHGDRRARDKVLAQIAEHRRWLDAFELSIRSSDDA